MNFLFCNLTRIAESKSGKLLKVSWKMLLKLMRVGHRTGPFLWGKLEFNDF